MANETKGGIVVGIAIAYTLASFGVFAWLYS